MALNQQNIFAFTELARFQRIVPPTIVDKYQDWQFRQQFQYEALLGYITNDFLSIVDFIRWMDLTQVVIPDKEAWKMVRGSVPPNPIFRASRLMSAPGMGIVGKLVGLFNLAGFTKVFVESVTIIKDKVKGLG